MSFAYSIQCAGVLCVGVEAGVWRRVCGGVYGGVWVWWTYACMESNNAHNTDSKTQHGSL